MTKTCKQCSADFEVTDADRAFYEKVSPTFGGKKYLIPEPTFCPDCRLQRRKSFRNEYELYKGKSSLSGKPLVTMFSPDKKVTIYSYDEWWSDDWDATDYGQEFDFSRSFFDQFAELFRRVPQMNLVQDGTSENCEYTNFGGQNKNCYLAQAFRSEDIYYGDAFFSKNCIDCFYVSQCERVYESLDSYNSFNSAYLQNSNQCSDSFFLDGCTNCQYCLGCKNLKNKQYHIFNKPYSKEEYFQKLKSFKLNTHSGLQKFREQFEVFRLTLPYKFNEQRRSENSTGNFLEGAKDCFNCYDIVAGARSCRNSNLIGLNAHDLMDCSAVSGSFCYEIDGNLDGNQICFGHHIRNGSDIFYCLYVYNCNNLFGCTGMKSKKYCILNKQYTKEEYESLVPKIIDHMKLRGEWGEFFPTSLSPFGYNETQAHILFPLSKEEALEKGFRWSDYEAPIELTKSISAARLPDDINDVPDDILKWAIVCEITKKPFKIIPQELKFYREMQIPVPHRSPRQRHKDRFSKRNPYHLWARNCSKCQVAIKTSYSPERPEIIYCEQCYLNEIY